jgi:hypothetical protein
LLGVGGQAEVGDRLSLRIEEATRVVDPVFSIASGTKRRVRRGIETAAGIHGGDG